jgi:hypothetical protein
MPPPLLYENSVFPIEVLPGLAVQPTPLPFFCVLNEDRGQKESHLRNEWCKVWMTPKKSGKELMLSVVPVGFLVAPLLCWQALEDFWVDGGGLEWQDHRNQVRRADLYGIFSS